jgi:hypothetical protein
VLTGCCGEGTHVRDMSATHLGGPPTYRPPVAPEPIDQIGSGSLHRLRERAIDDEVGSGAPAAGLEINTMRAATFSGMPIRLAGFKAIADLKASGALRSTLRQTPLE